MTRADMYIVIEKVGKKWKWMAREMISDGQIESIDYDYEKDGLNEKVRFEKLKFKNSTG